MRVLILLLLCSCALFLNAQDDKTIYQGSGEVYFISEAPLETIEATSKDLKGLLNIAEKTFAFTIKVQTFDGFNSALQKEHFNEHYLESEEFPKSTFKGKLVGTFDCDDCTQELLAKGTLTIHNVSKVVVIPVKISKANGELKAESNFKVKLVDYDISIPKILEAKISPIISVEVELDFEIYESN